MNVEAITLTSALIRLGVALALGLCIGTERQLHKHTAGVRTFALICLGSALAMIVSIYICQTNTDLLNGDPGRIAAQVLTGIGFIGAGLILKHGDGVSGLTTAACVFITSIIGLAAGAGLMLVASIITAVVIILLASSPLIRTKILHEKDDREDD